MSKRLPPADTQEFLRWLRNEAEDSVFRFHLREIAGVHIPYRRPEEGPSAHEPRSAQA